MSLDARLKKVEKIVSKIKSGCTWREFLKELLSGPPLIEVQGFEDKGEGDLPFEKKAPLVQELLKEIENEKVKNAKRK